MKLEYIKDGFIGLGYIMIFILVISLIIFGYNIIFKTNEKDKLNNKINNLENEIKLINNSLIQNNYINYYQDYYLNRTLNILCNHNGVDCK